MTQVDTLQGQRRISAGLLFLLGGLAALGALSTNIMLPSFPAIAQALHASPHGLGLTLSSFFITFALGQLLVGPLSDRLGRRPVVLAGLAVFVAGSAICGLADSLALLVAGRVVQALGVCAVSVLARAIARDLFEGEALTRVLAFTMVIMSSAPGFSPLIGGLLDTAFGWRAAFVFVGVLSLVVGFMYVSRVGETLPLALRAPSSPGMIARGYAELLGDWRFSRPALAVSLVIGALYAFFASAPGLLMGQLGLSAVQLGVFFALTVLVVFAAGLLSPRLVHRFGVQRVMRAGAGLALAGSGLLMAWAGSLTLLTFSLAMTVFLFGMGLANPVGTAAALQPFANRAGLASALIGFLQMAMAAGASALALGLPYAASVSLAGVLALATGAALVLFLLPGGRQSQVQAMR
ncbi:multidrug effflux MFS transporter [Pseudomonas entomophila]|uniref:multidrug effflux MFS transporter n=1 Tax=Pseudomonas entomophila TaxID=312306 RepID=UPI0023D7C07D|nr:multidrug effflux MFS transporter [Pseudomonas entomophila]MDF0733039.1 multidrug effflux MFS transporter [Pseudomonas entomophila]